MAKIERLTAEMEDKAIDCVLEGHSLEGIACTLGFAGKPKLMRYLAKFPDFQQRFQTALSASCMDLEEQLLQVADRYEKDVARVKMESLKAVLKYRDPKRYGDKLDMNVNVTVDISKSLDAAEQRVIDVTPTITLLPTTTGSVQDPGNE